MKSYKFFFIFNLFFLPMCWLSAGDIVLPNQYAWGENAGWINFGVENGAVQVFDDRLTGYAWDEIFGWLNLAPDQAGVLNDGQGNLSGKAWSAGGGWVDFSGVTIDSAGKFSGQATSETYGRINFDCDFCSVVTDWRLDSEEDEGQDILDMTESRNGGGSGSRSTFWFFARDAFSALAGNVVEADQTFSEKNPSKLGIANEIFAPVDAKNISSVDLDLSSVDNLSLAEDQNIIVSTILISLVAIILFYKIRQK